MKGISVTVKLQGVDVLKVYELKYLVSTIQSNEQSPSKVKKRARAEWNG